MQIVESFDKDVRYFIYTTFVETALPPTTRQVSEHLKVSIASVENSFERLADSHHIALAPGSHSIWMAHPFSGIPTNYVTTIGQKKYYGN